MINTASSTPNEIHSYLHCSRCIHEMPVGQSPRDWAMLSVGATENGIQVWCVRHECNVALITMDKPVIASPHCDHCEEERIKQIGRAV